MQFLALVSDLTVATETRDKYKYVAELKCSNCPAVYHLWAPFLETEESEVVAQSTWLYNYLKKKCPEHADVLFTPDRPR